MFNCAINYLMLLSVCAQIYITYIGKITCAPINLDGLDIPLTTQVTCLGVVIIDSELKLDMQIRRVSKVVAFTTSVSLEPYAEH